MILSHIKIEMILESKTCFKYLKHSQISNRKPVENHSSSSQSGSAPMYTGMSLRFASASTLRAFSAWSEDGGHWMLNDVEWCWPITRCKQIWVFLGKSDFQFAFHRSTLEKAINPRGVPKSPWPYSLLLVDSNGMIVIKLKPIRSSS